MHALFGDEMESRGQGRDMENKRQEQKPDSARALNLHPGAPRQVICSRHDSPRDHEGHDLHSKSAQDGLKVV